MRAMTASPSEVSESSRGRREADLQVLQGERHVPVVVELAPVGVQRVDGRLLRHPDQRVGRRRRRRGAGRRRGATAEGEQRKHAADHGVTSVASGRPSIS